MKSPSPAQPLSPRAPEQRSRDFPGTRPQQLQSKGVGGQELPGGSSVTVVGACGHGERKEGFWYKTRPL